MAALQNRSTRKLWRMWAAGLVLLGYLVGAVGIMPSPATVGAWLAEITGGVWRVGERYPCEADACGCGSAGECWTTCGCQTREQKLAWALANGVMPPVGVCFSDDEWVTAANLVKRGSAECSLCVGPLQEQLRRGVALQGALGAGMEDGGAGCCDSGGADATSSRGVGLTIRAKSCKGMKELFSVAMVPPVKHGAGTPMLLGAGSRRVMLPSDERAASRVLEAAVPPPRCAV